MKERELREHAKCNYCNRLLGESQVPGFHVVEVKSYSLEVAEIKRQTALGMCMGPDRDLAKEVYATKTTMCWPCWAEKMPEPQEPEQ